MEADEDEDPWADDEARSQASFSLVEAPQPVEAGVADSRRDIDPLGDGNEDPWEGQPWPQEVKRPTRRTRAKATAAPAQAWGKEPSGPPSAPSQPARQKRKGPWDDEDAASHQARPDVPMLPARPKRPGSANLSFHPGAAITSVASPEDPRL